MDWNEIDVKSTPLSFINSDDELKKLFINSVVFSDLMQRHEPVRLSHYLENTQYGYTTSSSENGQYRFLRITDIQEGKVNWGTVPYCDCNKPDKYLLAKNDILIARTGGSTGKSFLIKESLNNADFASYLIRLRIKEKVYPGFISLYLNSYLFWTQILELKSGSAQPNVNAEKLKTLLVPKVDPQQQKEIYETVVGIKPHSSYAEIKVLIARSKSNFVKIKRFGIEISHQQALLKQLRQAILQEAVQGKLTEQWRSAHPEVEPASALLERIQAEKARLVKEKRIKKSKPLPPITPDDIPFDFPEGWVWCRLGDVSSKIGSGSTPKGGKDVYVDEGIPFFRSQNIYEDGLRLDDVAYISEEVQAKMSGTQVFPNDVLLNITGGSIGRATHIPGSFLEGNVSQHVSIIRPILFDSIYLHKIILSPFLQKDIYSSTTGAGREGLPKYNLEKFLIPLPSLAEQKAIVEKVESLLAKVNQLEQEAQQNQQHAEQLLQSVLREVMNPVSV